MAEAGKESTTFTENLRAPGWMFAFLGLMLGGTSGGLTAAGIRSLGDDPLVTGVEALVFFVCFAVAVVGIVYVMLGSTLMETRVTREGINVKLGLLGTQRTFGWTEIGAVRSTGHSIARHGGRGNPFTPASRRSWTMYGVRTGIEIEVGDGMVFVSSRKGEELVDVADGLIGRK